MALIKVTPSEKDYVISEERLRFAVPADIPPAQVPYHIYLCGALQGAIDTYQKFKGWVHLDSVPRKKAFHRGKPCCTEIISKKPGEQLTLKFLPSSFQGDTDDAHNFGELSNPDKRMHEENLIDWVAVVHFLVPTIAIDLDKEREISNSLSYEDGFVPLADLPSGLQEIIQRKTDV